MRFRTLFVALALVGAFVYFTTAPNSPLRRYQGPLWSGPAVAHSAGLGGDELNNIDIYKSAKDSVAYITSTVYQQTFFFEMVPTRALGSGFLISPDGRILTNNHVISGSAKIEVRFSDGSRYTAKVLVADRADDLAVIQIEPKKKVPFLKLGDSDALQVGQKVLAIGNPFGFSGTLTTGVVSSLAREIRNENNTLEGLIQTDAAINEGNSGGPLLDSQGNVIGINTAILAPSGGNIGIGFAMPINRAKAMLEDFRAGKSFGRPRFGASTVFITGDLAAELKLPTSGGLLIQEIGRGSAAEQAGLKGYRDVVLVGNERLGIGGDFITQIDGKPVTESDALSRAIARKRPGDTITVKVFRAGKLLDVAVKLGEVPEEKF
ncbi:MAG TPA: trypsin-like peptidase domain-containing protein [Bryobacteraceae bacterium]|jgi:S1-C subfamily serine protease|nr:trypsin-like peptidase domain-containing protein [Bryobacteraceae bacterium]